MKKRLFISYSHKDTERVVSIVRKLTLSGFDVWMDVKDIIPGDNYILKIFEGVHSSDIYVIFLSQASLNSKYVSVELSHAVKRHIENPQFRIIPIVLEHVEIPNELKTIDYIDATSISSNIVGDISNILDTESTSLSDIKLAAFEFRMSKRSNVEFSASSYYEREELRRDCELILKNLREKVWGILLNFTSINDFDFTSNYPFFTNGLYSEDEKIVPGRMGEDNCKCITTDVIVFNPVDDRVWDLFREHNKILEFDSVSFCYAVPMGENDTYDSIGRRCLIKLQKNYTFLSYNVLDGAKIMYEDNFFLSFAFTNEAIKITLTTTGPTKLNTKLQTFNVYAFLKELMA